MGSNVFEPPPLVELSRKESHRLEISFDGYHPETVEIVKVSNSAVAGNIIAGGLIGLAVDYSSGSAYRLVPDVVKVALRPVVEEQPKSSDSSNETQVDD